MLTKRLNSTSDWRAWDTVRNIYNISMAHTKLNDTASENTSIGMDILSNGFKIRSADSEFNASGSFYLYLVFADESFKYTTAK